MLPRFGIVRPGVVVDDLARQVQPERDELLSRSSRRCRPPCPPPPRSSGETRTDRRPGRTRTSTTRTARPRPACRTSATSSLTCTNRRPLRRDVVGVAHDSRDRRGVEVADLRAIDRRRRAGVERRAAQRIERRHRAVDVDGRRTVERQINLFFVLVLPEESTGAARRRDDGTSQAAALEHAASPVMMIPLSSHQCPPSRVALSHRRQLADVPRVSRAGAHRRGRPAAQRQGPGRPTPSTFS